MLRFRSLYSLRYGSCFLASVLIGSLASAQSVIGKGDLVDPESVADLYNKTPIPSDPKIADDLLHMVNQLRGASGKSSRTGMVAKINSGTSKRIIEVDSEEADSVLVYLRMNEMSSKAIGLLEEYGVEIDIISQIRPLIQAYVPLSQLESVAALDIVAEVTRPNYALATAGPNITEGDLIQGTNFIRAGFTFFSQDLDSVDGRGTTIGVLSNSLYAGEYEIGLDNSFSALFCNSLQYREVESPLPELESDLPRTIYLNDDNPATPERIFPNSNGRDCPPSINSSTNRQPLGYYGAVRIFPTDYESHILPDTESLSVDSPIFRSFPEGTAMLEVVHDIAPGATKFYGDGRTSLGLETSRQYLIPSLNSSTNTSNPNNIDVIVDNLVYFGEGRYDGSSAISRQASFIARSRNIPYIVSVGGQSATDFNRISSPGLFPFYVNGYFNPDPRTTRSSIHSWNRNTSLDRDEVLDISVSPGQVLEFTLVWDDIWEDFGPRASIDFDLYLVPKRSVVSLSDAVAASTRTQNGSSSNPIERLVYTVPSGSDPVLGLVIVNRRVNTGVKTFFTLVMENTTVIDSQYLTHGVPGNNADAQNPAISVGHIDITTSVSNLSFTSDVIPGLVPGPAYQTSFFSWYDNLSQPDVISYGSVSTQVTGERNFTGPSAAAAHIGGYAALLRHRFPNMPPQRILELLTDTNPVDSFGEPIAPFATDVTPRGEFGIDTTSYNKSPRYIRPNTFAIFSALQEDQVPAYGDLVEVAVNLTTPEQSDSGVRMATDWTKESKGNSALEVSSLGLEIQPSGEGRSRWVSPILETYDPATAITRSTLQPGRHYVLKAQVASTSPNPEEIPNFHLKAVDDKGRILNSVAVNPSLAGFAGSPTSLSGRQYELYIKAPENLNGATGLKLMFEAEAPNSVNNDSPARVILREATLTEVLVPAQS